MNKVCENNLHKNKYCLGLNVVKYQAQFDPFSIGYDSDMGRKGEAVTLRKSEKRSKRVLAPIDISISGTER